MFLLICILIMWAMIFGMAFFYIGSLKEALAPRMLYQFTLAIIVATVAWLFGAYFLAFEGHWSSVVTAGHLSLYRILDILFQLCFCLYAVVMFIGSIIDRVKTRSLLLAVFVWVFLVYSPLAYLIWRPEGFLAQMGVEDFSGGIVVHLSAGLSTYVLAYYKGRTDHIHDKLREEWLYLGMILVTLGWFGFNVVPVGQLNDAAGQVLLNTLLAIISGGLAWSLASYFSTKEESSLALLNGMIVGLVTSTAGVGYLDALPIVIVTFLASFLTYFLTDAISKKLSVDDVVDPFGMNGIGGLLGSLGVIVFHPHIIGAQLLAIAIASLLSLLVTWAIARFIMAS
ncbi:ammonium transporter [Streptococcus ictaluri]|uniref:Ammonium transporter n=1 Tax=Streptococcus ictaluri 707-05 TaxID=764299 RepID=G5K269_9STRE|nr:ammonium transporter [Streptococcus ictaluri]EHI70046.1 ammonium transporter [Streptococcus ictaluri 707-05]